MSKILVLDDDKNFTNIVERFLSLNTPYEVFVANSAKQAYAIAIEVNIDIFLIDLTMEIIDGIQFVKMIRQLAIYQDNPIIVVTGSEDQDYKNTSLQVGASALLNKPIDFSVLTTYLADILAEWESETANRINKESN